MSKKINIPGCPYEAFLLPGINAIKLNCSEKEYLEIIIYLDFEWFIENNLEDVAIIYNQED